MGEDAWVLELVEVASYFCPRRFVGMDGMFLEI